MTNNDYNDLVDVKAIKDSGNRREFSTGAVRDMVEGKGRFDLAPLEVLASLAGDKFLTAIADYTGSGDQWCLYHATEILILECCPTAYHAYLELAKHFENGAKKYGEYNWQKGIESRSYIDSAVRHYCKHKAGIDDEPHAVAALWNCVCCLWTINNKPELNSFAKEREANNEQCNPNW